MMGKFKIYSFKALKNPCYDCKGRNEESYSLCREECLPFLMYLYNLEGDSNLLEKINILKKKLKRKEREKMKKKKEVSTITRITKEELSFLQEKIKNIYATKRFKTKELFAQAIKINPRTIRRIINENYLCSYELYLQILSRIDEIEEEISQNLLVSGKEIVKAKVKPNCRVVKGEFLAIDYNGHVFPLANDSQTIVGIAGHNANANEEVDILIGGVYGFRNILSKPNNILLKPVFAINSRTLTFDPKTNSKRIGIALYEEQERIFVKINLIY